MSFEPITYERCLRLVAFPAWHAISNRRYNEEYIIDDYGTALIGTNTIDLYKPTRIEMRRWGVRHVDIDILQWGSEERSLKCLQAAGEASTCSAHDRQAPEEKFQTDHWKSRPAARFDLKARRDRILSAHENSCRWRSRLYWQCLRRVAARMRPRGRDLRQPERRPSRRDRLARAIDRRRSKGSPAIECHVLAAARPDAVMHFAANALVGESMQNPSKYFRNNIANGLNLLDAMVATGVKRIVFSSTCAIFGPPERLPIDEAATPRPINPYGESKLAFEKILRWYDEIHGLHFVSLRYFNAAGASEKFGEDHRTETHLIPNVLKVALGEKPHVEIYGTDYETPDGTCIRDYIHILDLARAHILALNATKSEFYNLGTGGGSSVREVMDACQKFTGRKIDVVEKPRRPAIRPV